MAAGNQKKQKDAEMAKRLKAEGVSRSSARCPICSGIIPIGSYYNHVAFHPAYKGEKVDRKERSA